MNQKHYLPDTFPKQLNSYNILTKIDTNHHIMLLGYRNIINDVIMEQ
jgi:hypothetical protein